MRQVRLRRHASRYCQMVTPMLYWNCDLPIPSVQAGISELLNLRITLNQEIAAVLAEQAALAQAALKEKHEELKIRVRELQKQIADTNQQMLYLRGEIARCHDASNLAFNELRDARQARAALSRYATDAEIKKADAAIAKAEENWKKVPDAEAAPTIEHNQPSCDGRHAQAFGRTSRSRGSRARPEN